MWHYSFAVLKLTWQVCKWGIVPESNHLSHRLSCCQSLGIMLYRCLLLNLCLVYINCHAIVLSSYSIYCCFKRIYCRYHDIFYCYFNSILTVCDKNNVYISNLKIAAKSLWTQMLHVTLHIEFCITDLLFYILLYFI